jgi:hypothetical protein
MPNDHPRMVRERKTIETMVQLYCGEQHGARGEPCANCQELRDYALSRLDQCRYQENKTTCANCPTHCYKPIMRERVKVIMRHAGPRMLRRHPILAIRHLLDRRRKQPLGVKREPQKTA